MEELLRRWDEIKEYVRDEHELSPISFNTWIKPLKIYNLLNNKVFISIPFDQSQSKAYISKKYYLPIKVAINELLNADYDIEFILEKDEKNIELNDYTDNNDNKYNKDYEDSNLNHTYTFDTFVIGSNNRFAHSAALAVAESPGEISMYNPLFIYGGVGLGKTHLMHAIANFIKKNNPDSNVLYVTSEDFTNEVIESIRRGKDSQTEMKNFREKYRNVDVLLIDDIQFIIGKEQTQEEFFHTFNKLHEDNKQIIISSDRPPKEMKTLDERFKSRFTWGLLADIQQPDYETRMAILLKKRDELNFDYKNSITDEIIDYIAKNVTSNVRELEGALNKIIVFSRLENKEINISFAKEALEDVITPVEAQKITPEYILDIVCDHFGVLPDDVCSKKRNAEIVLPRQIIMYLCREYTDAAQVRIALLCGKKDHTTVIHAEEKIKQLIEDNDDYVKSNIDSIIKKINPS